jgi:hypothetical protein
VHLDYSLHTRSSSFAVSFRTTITDLHTFLSLSHSFLFAAGWWLSYCCQRFRPPWESRNVRTHCQKFHIFMTWNPPPRHLVENRILRDTRTELLNPQNRVWPGKAGKNKKLTYIPHVCNKTYDHTLGELTNSRQSLTGSLWRQNHSTPLGRFHPFIGHKGP